jgi:hypothetical protein
MQGVPCDRPGATRLSQGSGLSVVAAKYMCTRPDGFQRRPLIFFVSDLASLAGGVSGCNVSLWEGAS